MKEEVLAQKLDNIREDLSEVKVTLVKNVTNLEHLNEQYDSRFAALDKKVETIEKDIIPLNRHMAIMSSFVKAIGVLGGIVGLILGFIELASKLK